jgi:hypothetical protein
VKGPRYDDERLAALLAGRLEGQERDELLAYLSTTDADLEVFAHSAAILREMDEEDAQEEKAGTKAPPPRREERVPSMSRNTRGWPRKPPRWAVLSALAGLLVLGWLGWLAWPGRGTPGVSPVKLAMSLDSAGSGLPFDALRPSEGIPGNSTRGEGASARTRESAAQAGAFLVRLVLSVQAGDSAATASLAVQMRTRFDPQGSSALRQIEARAGAPPTELQPLLQQATERLEGFPEAGDLRLGAWTEAGHWAAHLRDTGYFRSEDTASMLGLAERLTKDDPQAREAVAAVRRALRAEPRDWTALETDLVAMLQAIAS